MRDNNDGKCDDGVLSSGTNRNMYHPSSGLGPETTKNQCIIYAAEQMPDSSI